MKARSVPWVAFLISIVIATPGLAEKRPNEIVCAVKQLGLSPGEPGALLDFAVSNLQNLIYGSLVMAGDATSEYQPDLAERWAISADGLTWTFFLRKGVRFHDGTDFTAADVERVYRSILDPASDSPVRLLFRVVKAVKAEGKDTVKVQLSAPYGPLPYLMSRTIPPTQPRPPGKLPVGTGPFKLTSVTKDEFVFEANPDYYAGRPKLDRLVFRMYPDQKKAWVALMQGAVDVVTDLEQEDYDVIKDDPRFKTFEIPDSFCYSLIFNTQDPLLSSREVRRAICQAIDRNDLIDRGVQGAGIPTSGPFLPRSWAFDPDPSLQAFDLPKARQVLAQLGWKDTNSDWALEKDGKTLTLSVLVDEGDTIKEAVATRLRWQLLQAGMKVEVESLPLDRLFAERLVPGKFQAVLMQTNSTGDPDQILNAFWHSDAIGRTNLARYNSSALDQMIEKARATTDPGKRKTAYQEIHRFLAEEAPAAFLFVKKRYSATSARVAGVKPSLESFYNVSLRDWYVVDASTEGR